MHYNECMNSKRIEWIDIAKGIAIILMVASHGMIGGGLMRNYVFSFHMPILFSISAYNMRLPNNKELLIDNIKKDLKGLIGYYFLFAIAALVLQIVFADHLSLEFVCGLLQHQSLALLWGSGISVYNFPPIGMIWFLISLFFAKTTVNVVYYFFNNNHYYESIYVVLVSFGLILARYDCFLPLNLDVSLVCIFFLWMGLLYKRYESKIDENYIMIILISFIIQFACLNQNIQIDISGRTYNSLSLLMAVSGELVIVYLCKALTNTTYLKKALSFFGKETLVVLFVHYNDFIIMNKIGWGYGRKYVLIRLLIVIPISIIIILIKKKIRYSLNK